MIDKRFSKVATAMRGIRDGASVMISGFGVPGTPLTLLDFLLEQGSRELTIICNNPATGFPNGIAALLHSGRVRKVVCSYPRTVGLPALRDLYAANMFEMEVVPQGTLIERIRSAAAGLGGFYTPTGADTKLAEGRETKRIDGRLHVFEQPLGADVALVKAYKSDRWGNLVYRASARNFGPMMVAAARLSVVQVEQFVDLGDLDPEHIITPGIFVDRVVEVTSDA